MTLPSFRAGKISFLSKLTWFRGRRRASVWALLVGLATSPLSVAPVSARALESTRTVDALRATVDASQRKPVDPYPDRRRRPAPADSPRLSLLSYSSARGNGILGSGWQLPFGEIRCSLRKGVPGTPGCEEYELDGELLVGPDQVGAYHTLIETFSRIRPLPDGSWELTQTDGRIRSLWQDGRQSDPTRTEKPYGGCWPQVERSWTEIGLRSTTTRLGDVGTLYPREIRYGLAGTRKIELLYQPRPDPIFDHPGGIERSVSQRLYEIRVLVNETNVFSRWILGYEPDPAAAQSTRLSRLRSLQRFGTDCPTSRADPRADCIGLPPRVFSYGETGSVAWEADDDWQIPFPLKTQIDYLLRDFNDTQIGDVNGDGLPDLIHDPLPLGSDWAPSADRPSIYLNTGAGWDTPDWADETRQTGPENESAEWTQKLRQLRVQLPRFTATHASGPAAAGISRVSSSTVEETVEFSFTALERQPAYAIAEDELTGDLDVRLLGSFSLVDIDSNGFSDLVMSVRLSGVTIWVDEDGTPLPEASRTQSPGRTTSIVLRNTGSIDPSDPEQNPWVLDPDLANALPPFATLAVEGADYVNDVMGDPGWGFNDILSYGPCYVWGMTGARFDLYPFDEPDGFDDWVCSMTIDYRPIFSDFDGDGYLDILALDPDDPDALFQGDVKRMATGALDEGLPTHRTSKSSSSIWIQVPDAVPGAPRWRKAPEFKPPFPHVWLRHGRGDKYDFLNVAPNTSDSPSYDTGFRVIDLDRDGLSDIVWTDVSAENFTPTSRFYRDDGPSVVTGVLLNTGRGNGSDSSVWCASRAFAILPDPTPASPTQSVVAVCDQAARYELPEDETFIGNEDGRSMELWFADVNGDGWPDLVKAFEQHMKTWLHEPDSRSVWVENPFFRPPIQTNYLHATYQSLGTLLIDANADGVTDFLSDGRLPNPTDPLVLRSHLGTRPFPDLLTRYDNGRGGLETFEYVSAASNRVANLPSTSTLMRRSMPSTKTSRSIRNERRFAGRRARSSLPGPGSDRATSPRPRPAFATPIRAGASTTSRASASAASRRSGPMDRSPGHSSTNGMAGPESVPNRRSSTLREDLCTRWMNSGSSRTRPRSRAVGPATNPPEWRPPMWAGSQAERSAMNMAKSRDPRSARPTDGSSDTTVPAVATVS